MYLNLDKNAMLLARLTGKLRLFKVLAEDSVQKNNKRMHDNTICLLFGALGPSRYRSVCRCSLHQQVVPVVIWQEDVPCFLLGSSRAGCGSGLILWHHHFSILRRKDCPDLRKGGSPVPGACVAPHGVHQRIGGECVVGGPRAHVLLKALNDGPVGPEDHRWEHKNSLLLI